MSTVERLRGAKSRVAEGTESGELGEFACLVAGEWLKTGDAIEVHSPYDDSLVAVVHRAGRTDLERAISGAMDSFDATRHLASWKRSEILSAVSQAISDRHEAFSRAIAMEAGKPIKTARAEVDRAVFTFKVAAEETRRQYGEIVPLDWLPGTEGRVGEIRRVPLGPVLGITPFNFPLNLVAHKVAPALAAGDPIIIRPSSQTPLSALMLGQVVLEAGWPQGAISVVPCTTKDADVLVEDDRIRVLTFTGSPAVGWALKARSGRKRVTLELGGNAGVIVNKDADLDYAATRVAWGGYSYAGQSCISVQRTYVHRSIYDAFVEALVPKVKALKLGDPLDEATDVGPLIDAGAAERVEDWVKLAVEGGAEVLAGGTRQGTAMQPTLLASVKEDMLVSCNEIFGPVVSLYAFDDVEDAIRAVDTGDFGLQAGLFTNDWDVIQKAFDQIEVGGLMVNDVSTFRVDHMPYGGVKMSGAGREGLRYAIEEMSEMKLLMLHHRSA